MCVYSDSLDWVIDFSPQLHRIARIMDPSNCIICSRYQIVRDCVYLSYLNTHKPILDKPDGLQPCKIRGARK